MVRFADEEFQSFLEQRAAAFEKGDAKPFEEAMSGVIHARTGVGKRAFQTSQDRTWNPEYPYPQVVTNTSDPTRPRTVAAGYDPSSQILMVTFREGAVYQYYNVPEYVWNSFREDPSPGRYLDDVLNAYSYSRVNEYEGLGLNADTTMYQYRGGGWYYLARAGDRQLVRGKAALPEDSFVVR